MLTRTDRFPRARFAVIVNPRAGRMRASALEQLHELVPCEDLFVATSAAQSREIARTVIQRGYRTVLLAGGDGTFVRCVNELLEQARRAHTSLPRVGLIPLGSGNAIADTLGSSEPMRNLDTTRAEAERALALLLVDGQLTPFAGCGLDARIVGDYERVRGLLGGLGGHLGPIACYALAIALLSLPRFMLARRPTVVVINAGAPALPIEWWSGRVLDERAIPKGRILYRGRSALASASTIPRYGLGLKVFPYAQTRAGRFHLRCAEASASEILCHLPSIFRGDYKSSGFYDFLCSEIEIRVDRPVPMQVGGDLQPRLRDRIRIALAPEPVRFVV